MSLRSGMWAVLFTDMVDSTSQRARLGDAPADDIRRAHDRIAEFATRRHSGEFVKGTGDGAMLAFPSAADAVEAAIAIQQGVLRRNAESAEPIRVRIGVSVGEVECEDDDLFGLAVNEAARVCAIATAGEIVISDLVRAVAGSRLGAPVETRAPVELKGIPGQVTVWSVAWQPAPAPEPAPFPALLGSGREPPFKGRSFELDALAAAWGETAAGACGAAFVTGEPGIGKTRLAAEIARRAHGDGAVVLFGSCDEALAAPFQPFAEALDWYCVHAPVAMLGRYPDDLARLSDRVLDHLQRAPARRRADAEGEQLRLFESVSSWLGDVSQDAPVLLVIDDLHWATRETLLLLRHVLRSSPLAPIFVLGTYRDTDLDRQHPLSGMLGDFTRLGIVERVALQGLQTPDVLGLVHSYLSDAPSDTAGAEALAESIHAETEGNAFFVNEVLRNFVDAQDGELTHGATPSVRDFDALAIPQGVREVIGQRLDRLGGAATAVLRAAAVVGRAFSLSATTAGAGVSENDALEVLEHACETHLCEEIGPERFRFSHALVRTTLLNEITATRRMRMHRAIAAELESSEPRNVADLAYHWCSASEAGDLGKAVSYSIDAAANAMARSAYENAAAIVQRALELVEEDDLLERELLVARGRAEVAVGDAGRYRPTFRRIADLASGAGDIPTFARAVLGYLGSAETITSLDEFGRHGLERSLAEIDRSAEPMMVPQLLGALACGVTNREPGRGDELSREALDLARAAGAPEAFALAAGARLRCWWDPQAVDARLALVAEMRAAGEAAGSPEAVASAWRWEANIRFAYGDLAAVGHALDEVDAINETLDQRYFHWVCAARRASIALSVGDLTAADRLMQEAVALESHGFSIFVGQFAVLRWLQGRMDEIVDLVLGENHDEESIDPLALSFFALATAESGRLDEAAAAMGAVGEAVEQRSIADIERTAVLAVAGRAARLVDRGSWIAPLLELCEPLRGQFANVNPGGSSLGSIEGTRGGILLAAGRYDEAIAALASGVAQNQAAGLRPFVATALADLSAAFEASGQADAAAAARADALELAAEIGMAHIIRQLGS